MSALASARTGLGVIGALCGAAGVAFSALAAHAGGNGVATAAQFLLFHAPLFVALALLRPPGGVLLAAWGILAGLILFSGDLLARHYLGDRLFPMAAPTGGFLMIAGWAGLAAMLLLIRSDRLPGP
jgi:uncharacterized membrane protein YgdD (TMEM256/DUF423 family)